MKYLDRYFILDKMNEMGALLENNINNMRQFYGEWNLYVNCQLFFDDLDVNVEAY